MASSRLSKLVLLLALAAHGAWAQERVRGVIATVTGDTLAVAGTQVRIGEATEIIYLQPLLLGDIKAGDFLGVTSMKGPDGKLTAIEVRRVPKPRNPGHRRFDGRDDRTMTNATVEALVQASTGRELTLGYPDGVQKVTVPQSATVSELVPGNRSQLVPGAPVSLTHDAGGMALRIQVGPRK